MPVTMIEMPEGIGTLAKFTGPEDSVEVSVKKYLSEYHPAGYGTFIRSTSLNEDGSVTTTVKRYNSCD